MVPVLPVTRMVIVQLHVASKTMAADVGSRRGLETAVDGNSVSKTKLAVRAESDKLKAFIVRLAVDQDEVRPDVAISVIAPLTTERVIEVSARQRLIVRQRVDGFE